MDGIRQVTSLHTLNQKGRPRAALFIFSEMRLKSHAVPAAFAHAESGRRKSHPQSSGKSPASMALRRQPVWLHVLVLPAPSPAARRGPPRWHSHSGRFYLGSHNPIQFICKIYIPCRHWCSALATRIPSLQKLPICNFHCLSRLTCGSSLPTFAIWARFLPSVPVKHSF